MRPRTALLGQHALAAYARDASGLDPIANIVPMGRGFPLRNSTRQHATGQSATRERKSSAYCGTKSKPGQPLLPLSRADRLSAARRPAPRAPARALELVRREPLVEGIAGAAHGADRVGLTAAHQRLAQAADVHVDGTLVDIDVPAPTRRSSNCSRVNTRPGAVIRNSSRRNSVGPRDNSRPERCTRAGHGRARCRRP